MYPIMTKEECTYWPKKYNLFGINVSATTYEEATKIIIQSAQNRNSAIVDHMPVHGLIKADDDSNFRSMINRFDIVAPDGQPVLWSLNLIHKTRLQERVYGPELMLRLCREASLSGIGIFLYGSLPQVLKKLQSNLKINFPSLFIAGLESPPFRSLSEEEDTAVVDRINSSGAGIVFVGLGCPKQEVFAFQHRKRIKAVQVCVGAAFDFIAGNKKMAPAWIQRNSLEWLFRLAHEPKRLWRRYLYTNSKFVLKIFFYIISSSYAKTP